MLLDLTGVNTKYTFRKSVAKIAPEIIKQILAYFSLFHLIKWREVVNIGYNNSN
jgi:hypothetical protein